MAALDEIDALEKGIQQINQLILQNKNQLTILNRQLVELQEGEKKAEELAELMCKKLLALKAADVVDMTTFSNTRSLYHRNKDLVSAKRNAITLLRTNIKAIEALLPEMEVNRQRMIEQHKEFGVVVPFKIP